MKNKTGKFIIKESDVDGNWYYSLHAANGEIVGRSPKGYLLASHASKKVNTCRSLISSMFWLDEGPGVDTEIWKSDKNEQHYFHISYNKEILLTSEGYTTKQSAEKGLESVLKNASKALIVEESL